VLRGARVGVPHSAIAILPPTLVTVLQRHRRKPIWRGVFPGSGVKALYRWDLTIDLVWDSRDYVARLGTGTLV
jgi:hypothetical protein